MNWLEYELRRQAMRKHEEMLLQKHGWILRYVFETEDREFDGLANIYTEGLQENFEHMDIQVVIPYSQQAIYPIVFHMVEMIKRGTVFAPETRSSEILDGADVYFRKFEYRGKPILRMFIPDKNRFLPFEDECDQFFKKQLDFRPE